MIGYLWERLSGSSSDLVIPQRVFPGDCYPVERWDVQRHLAAIASTSTSHLDLQAETRTPLSMRVDGIPGVSASPHAPPDHPAPQL